MALPLMDSLGSSASIPGMVCGGQPPIGLFCLQKFNDNKFSSNAITEKIFVFG